MELDFSYENMFSYEKRIGQSFKTRTGKASAIMGDMPSSQVRIAHMKKKEGEAMSAVAASTANLTRRNFLKASIAVAGGTWLGTAIGCSSGDSLSGEGSSSQAEEQVFNGVCKPNCFHGCQLKVHVREGKVVKTSAAPYPNPELNRICLRGLSHVTNIYDPDRVQYPLKRVGERGANEWERISWEDAIAEIAEKFTSYREEFGDQAVMKCAVSGNYGSINGGFTSKFFSSINASTMAPSLDLSNAIGLNRVVGWAGTWMGNDPRDLKNAKNIFIWGNNITDAQIHEWHFVADAIEAGSNVIVVDPIFTHMAAKAQKFVPIRPGADAALILSMMQVVIEEDLIDREFMQKYTVAPFLVRDDTGMFLRMSDVGVQPAEGPVNPLTGEPTKIDPAVVWDGVAGASASSAECAAPEIEGEFTVEGVACHTAYSLLKAEASQYPPDVAEGITEVPAATIVELAHLAADGPVTHRVGWGPQAYDNGVHPHHAGAALAAITGQMCEPGKIYGCADINGFTGFDATLSAPATPVTSPTISNLIMPEVMETGTYMGEDIVIKALWVYQGNPLCTFVDSNAKKKMFDKFEFIVTVDSMLTDTARYSDMVLPCAQFFEYEDIVGSGNNNHVVHCDKAIDPPFEAKPDTEIMRMLAEKMGMADLFPESDSEWLQKYVDTEAAAALGISYDALKEKKAIRWAPDPLVRWTDKKFLTPSGRMEFYVEAPTPMDDYGQQIDVNREHLPRFFPPTEAWPENPLHEKYPFVLLSERPRFRVHGQWFNNRILRELDPEPTVKINPADAAAKGIKTGDHVECYNDRGHAVAMAVLNEAVRPGTLVYPKSWQVHQHLAGGWSELSSSSHDPVAVNQSYMDELCDIRAWEGAE